MKSKTKFILLIIIMAIGLGLMFWGNHVMMNYDGFREVWKPARNAALPQFITGLLVLVVGYVLTYIDTKT